jgi:hypothetical protein
VIYLLRVRVGCVLFAVRWIGLRGKPCAYARQVFPEGTVTRIWFGGALLKIMRKEVLKP